MNSIGTSTKSRRGSAERSSFDRKTLPKPSENPNLTLDKFVSQPVIYVDQQIGDEELRSFEGSKEDAVEFDRDSDTEV